MRVPLVLRSGDELATRRARQPVPRRRASTPDELVVMFLADEPAAASPRSTRERSPHDEFRGARPRLYLRLPNGAADTKLTTPTSTRAGDDVHGAQLAHGAQAVKLAAQ